VNIIVCIKQVPAKDAPLSIAGTGFANPTSALR